MSTFVSILAGRPRVTEQPRVTPILEEVREEAVSRIASLRDEQIQALVEQLFFRPDSAPVRYVGFAASEPSTETAQLCLEAARVLAQEGRYDVGLIDANPDAVPLQTQLEVAPTVRPEATWPIAPRLWLVPRQSWLPASPGQRIPEQSFSRLRELTTEFDFAVLRCPVRLVANDQNRPRLRRTRAGVNGKQNAPPGRCSDERSAPESWTFLCSEPFSRERRLPVPEGLYRRL